MGSPTSRSLNLLKKEGWTPQVVEKWLPYNKVRVDLFGVIDILAIRIGRILGVQTTSSSNVSARVVKSLAEPKLKLFLQAGGRFEVHGWSKKGKHGKRKTWQVRKVVITLKDF
jgi:hypothetical protein